MDSRYSLTLSVLVLTLVCNVDAQSGIFDVTKYGAKVGSPDISQAIVSAWKEACSSTTPSTVVIPKGTYNVNQMKLQGPCKAPIGIQLQGILKAPSDPNLFKEEAEWFTVNYVANFTLSGGGTFDGQGKIGWSRNDCHKNSKCKKLPYNLSFNFLNNSVIRDITSLDSKIFHIGVGGCINLTFLKVNITAPEDAHNTDGIHIGRSSGINMTDLNIRTGDDCISIGDGSQDITISRVTCGPGHGISVGSLGKYPNEKDVRGIHVTNCTFTKTMNGVRVKTWPGSPVGVATDMHFEDIIMNDVQNPVIVDQQYCPWNQCTTQNPSMVKLSQMSFKNIRGSSSSQVAVKIVCSKSVPCENVVVGDIDLVYNGKEGPAKTESANVKPTFVGTQNPPFE